MSERDGGEMSVQDQTPPDEDRAAMPQPAGAAAATTQQQRDPMIIIGKLVNSAIREMNKQGGSSMRAIKKHIATKFKIHSADSEILNALIKQYLTSAVEAGLLVTRIDNCAPESSQPASSQPEANLVDDAKKPDSNSDTEAGES